MPSPELRAQIEENEIFSNLTATPYTLRPIPSCLPIPPPLSREWIPQFRGYWVGQSQTVSWPDLAVIVPLKELINRAEDLIIQLEMLAILIVLDWIAI
jgi:hypothetical protein